MSISDGVSIERNAVRILFILYFCNDRPPDEPLHLFDDYTHFISSESKLQKVDFWIRYPDHLAAALLRGCENLSLINRADDIKQTIRRIFQDREPTLRWIPMRKYLHGAYEPLDDAIGFLSSRLLAYLRVEERGHRKRYFLTRKGSRAVEAMLQECPITQWYAERCQLINSFFGHLNGFEIRQLQYLEENYDLAQYSDMIGRVET
ncbi:MAG: hypothetical protein EHM12_07780, partial [Dehalococcoidia bacterium]